MRVRKITPDQDLKEKEDRFLKLSGEERLRMMRLLNEQTRKPDINYELRNKKVKVIRVV